MDRTESAIETVQAIDSSNEQKPSNQQIRYTELRRGYTASGMRITRRENSSRQVSSLWCQMKTAPAGHLLHVEPGPTLKIHARSRRKRPKKRDIIVSSLVLRFRPSSCVPKLLPLALQARRTTRSNSIFLCPALLFFAALRLASSFASRPNHSALRYEISGLARGQHFARPRKRNIPA